MKTYSVRHVDGSTTTLDQEQGLELMTNWEKYFMFRCVDVQNRLCLLRVSNIIWVKETV